MNGQKVSAEQAAAEKAKEHEAEILPPPKQEDLASSSGTLAATGSGVVLTLSGPIPTWVAGFESNMPAGEATGVTYGVWASDAKPVRCEFCGQIVNPYGHLVTLGVPGGQWETCQTMYVMAIARLTGAKFVPTK
jgi:threonine dehydrogenase-like Zn-dependent dehydrogenase